MKEVNSIEGKAPEVAAKEAPFEIVIRTKDPEYIANGGPVEEVIRCAGYILSANIGDKTETTAQGEIYEDKVVFGIAKHIDHKELFMVAALGRLGAMKDTDD